MVFGRRNNPIQAVTPECLGQSFTRRIAVGLRTGILTTSKPVREASKSVEKVASRSGNYKRYSRSEGNIQVSGLTEITKLTAVSNLGE
jgi:hypothetical protein